jgi:hypothetical protein
MRGSAYTDFDLEESTIDEMRVADHDLTRRALSELV